MNERAVISLARQLADTFIGLDALMAEGVPQTDFTAMTLRKQGRILSADLKAALVEPVSVKPWSPWNQGAAE